MVVNELTPDSRRALADRYLELVINTPLNRVCDDLFGLARTVLERSENQIPGQHFLMPELFLPESIS